MSRYGRESERQAFSYMDNVPVKISEQYKPPRKVTLPVSCQHRLSTETVTEEYDFKLEKSVLQKMGEWRKLRKTAVENRRARIMTQKRATSKSQETRIVTTDSSVSPASSSFSTVELSDGSYANSTASSGSYPEPPPAYTNPMSCTTLAPVLQSISYSSLSSASTPQYSMLTPVPITLASIGTCTSKASDNFNISDFEADTSSPFDNMELKTINEMEELAHVLQPMSNSSCQVKQKPPDLEPALISSYSSPASFYSVDQLALCNAFDSNLKKGPTTHTHINGLTGYGLYGTSPRLKHQGIRNDGYATLVSHPYDYSIAEMPLKSESSYCPYPGRAWAASMSTDHADVSYSLDPVKQTDHTVTSENSAVVLQPFVTCSGAVENRDMVERRGYSTLTSTIHHPPLTYGASFPSTSNSNQDQHSPGRSLSRSVPDIVQELEKELKNKHVEESISSVGRSSHTPPPRPNSFGSTGLENWKPWPDLDSPERSQSETKRLPSVSSHSASKPVVKSTLPNPFRDLKPAAQNLVKHISEMGFPLPRVARACQLLGEDDKKRNMSLPSTALKSKLAACFVLFNPEDGGDMFHQNVVEFLLQVQCLEEKNYPGDQVEKALIVNKYNVTHAVKYLDAMIQLLDLGFPEQLVSDALVKFDNDRDKALDQLIS